MELLSITRAVVLTVLVCALPALADDNDLPGWAGTTEQAAPRVCQLDFEALAARCATAKPGAALR